MSFLEKIDKEKVQKILLIVIAALVLAALVSLVVIIITSIIPPNEIEITNKHLSTGSLILADEKHPYEVSDTSWLDLVNIKDYRNSQPDATGVETNEYSDKNYIPWKDMSFNKEAMSYAHKMLTAAKNEVGQNPLTIDAAYTSIKHGKTSFEYNTAMLMLLSDYDSSSTNRVPLSAEYRAWLDNNAAKYGYIESFDDAYRYVGVAHATYMTAQNLTLQQYIEYLKNNTSASSPLKITAGGDSYSVYYVSVSEGDKIKNPGGNYTLSGTNEGGVIVTVKTK